MKYLFLTVALTVFWCSSTHAQLQLDDLRSIDYSDYTIVFDGVPARGTQVGDPYCGSGINKYNLYARIADGEGGTWRGVVQLNSNQCGYDPDVPPCPPNGTDLMNKYCGVPDSPNFWERGYRTTLYTRVANGQCGTYRRVVEENSPLCPNVFVESVNPEGDRFRPVMFSIDAPEGYTYQITDSTIGNITETPDSLFITGDGRIGTGIIVIDDEEYSYQIVEEPRCRNERIPNSSSFVDCLGYNIAGRGQLGREAGFVYYGEDDERIVEWEWGWLWARNDEPYTLVEPGTDLYNKAEWYVEQMNDVLRLSGVFARIKLVGVATGTAALQIDMRNLYEIGMPRFDALAQEGTTYPNTCGVAYGTGYINKSPRTWLSNCGWYTALHEFGHNVGLNHGPFNSANEGTGWVFPDFGHGHYTNCINKDDLMSYSSYGVYFANSEILCSEMFDRPSDQPDLPSGIRTTDWQEDGGDTAYALNRIRYDIAMIHDEHETVQYDGLEYITVDAKPTGTLIID
jgi:hypothetical protein